MKKHLEQPRAAGRAKTRLQDVDKTIPHAAWSVLRWIVGSCTAHLEELTLDEERVKNIGTPRRRCLLQHVRVNAVRRARMAPVPVQRWRAGC